MPDGIWHAETKVITSSSVDQTKFFEDVHLGHGLVNKSYWSYFIPKKW
jgi:hypothetical protein